MSSPQRFRARGMWVPMRPEGELPRANQFTRFSQLGQPPGEEGGGVAAGAAVRGGGKGRGEEEEEEGGEEGEANCEVGECGMEPKVVVDVR